MDRKTTRSSISMHEDVPVWYDCCSCEAEPYWAELQAEEPAPGSGRTGMPDKQEGGCCESQAGPAPPLLRHPSQD